MKSLILLTTGRRKDLVIWEIKNQTEFAGIRLVDFKSLTGVSQRFINPVYPPTTSSSIVSGDAPFFASFKESNGSQFNEVLFRAAFSSADFDLLKEALGNCILLRSAYEEEVTEALGVDQLWKNLSGKGLASSVSG